MPADIVGPASHQVLPRDASGQATATWRPARSEVVEVLVSGPEGAAVTGAAPVLGRTATVVLPTGGPYEVCLRMADGDVHRVPGLLVGDVWVLAGQSNMQGVGEGAELLPALERASVLQLDGTWAPAYEPLHRVWMSPDNTLVRLFHLPNAAVTREQVLETYPTMHAQDQERPQGGVGPGWFFARDLESLTGVPVGLLPCALGGSSIDLWSRSWMLAHSPDDPRGSLYGNLVEQARGAGPVRGVLWFQGESEAMGATAASYHERFARLVADLRRDLEQPGLPFLTVQLGSVDDEDPHFAAIGDRLVGEWDRLREVQREAARTLEAVAVTAAADLPRTDLVHLATAGHERLGRRLAQQAAALLRGSAPSGPDVLAVRGKAGGTRVEVEVTGLRRGLQPGVDPRSFTLEGGPARVTAAVLTGPTTVVLTTDVPVETGTSLRYGAGANPLLCLYDELDVPVPCFGPVPLEEVDGP